jgi:hypothetical protein
MSDAVFTAARLEAATARRPAAAILTLAEPPDEASRRAVQAFLDALLRVAGRLDATRQEAAIARLAEALLPDPIAEARGALALDELRARDRFLAEIPTLTSAEVAECAASRSSNRAATAQRWKKARQVFSVQHRGAERYPGFQFRDGRPHPAIAAALAALPARMSPWQVAFWFVSANGWLGGAAPRERLDAAEALVAAARREGEELVG